MEDKHIKTFKEEAYDILSELEGLLLDLEANPKDKVIVDSVFGAMHTLKGSGAMFGFESIAKLSHEVETVLYFVREGSLAVTSSLISLVLCARDKIVEMLEYENQPLDDESISLIDSFRELIDTDAVVEETDTERPEEEEKKNVTYRIGFTPDQDIFSSGTNPLYILAGLQHMGECTIIPNTDLIPPLNSCDPESCYVSWEIILSTDQGINVVRDAFMFVENSCKLTIDEIYDHEYVSEEKEYKRLGEILLDRGDIEQDDLQKILHDQKRLGEVLVDQQVVPKSNVDAAVSEQEHVRNVIKKEQCQQQLSSIRVDSARLDSLVDLVGELVTVQAQLTEVAGDAGGAQLMMIAETVERLTDELRDNAMSIRMVPIGTLFSRFKRQVRDLSKELGKEVQLISEGAATELDKTVMDQLNEPLLHIIRNAIGHGVEEPSIRESLGKPSQGTIKLTARHVGATVEISVSDDGAGLDPEKLRSKALEKGIITPEEELSEKECYELIFRPGFTTTEGVTEVSGRGVGMDVVKRSINKLSGSIEIVSRKGAGTTITLRLSVTLAIIDGLLVRIGSELYIIPLSIVSECIDLSTEDSLQYQKRSIMTFRGEAFSFISLRKALGVEDEAPPKEKVILVNALGKKIGISVDAVVGQYQTVVKPLSWVYGNIEGLSGATILGNGTVAMILDVNQLANAEKTNKMQKDMSTV